MILRRCLIAVLGALALAAPGFALAQPDPVTVFAAASLKNALDDVDAAYAAKTGKQVRASYAASSALARQIEQGAPADVFISADPDWMDYVAQRRLIVNASRRDLLTNHLALIAPAASRIALRIGKGMPLAAALGDGRLAVAGPDVPAGKYAKASLGTLGVWDSVAGKLAPADNVRGALLFVARGETPLGIVYDTDAKVEPKVRIVGLFPDSSHPPIRYPAALVASGANPDAAAYFTFLQGPEAAAVFRKYSFIVLPRPR
ncbi:MAG TPA: molybdate ABC transporter substrate-binding protein [Caulobacteraceae bacterium]|nr:molybdate ABC transporter substrate-binding protein [Caulobacteraceae bacterium]